VAAGVREEAIRKGIHILASALAAAVLLALPRDAAGIVFAAATLVALSVEVGRRANVAFGARFDRALGQLIRPSESRRLTGATTLAIGFTVAVVLFPAPAALAGILVAGVADAVAAVVGRRFGRHRYPWGKSVEGSLAFFVIVTGIFVLTPRGLSLPVAAGIALLLTVLEALALPADDNLYLPAATALAVHLVGLPGGLTFFS
jgi:dolichol kinase